MKYVVWYAAAVLIIVTAILFFNVRITHDVESGRIIPIKIEQGGESLNETIITFVGDVMLGRGVEMLMDLYGGQYPFLNITDLLNNSSITVGNFEGIVDEIHTPTRPMSFQFGIQSKYFKELKNQGFDILSLANNHSFDYGTPAFLYTNALCAHYDLQCIGSPFADDDRAITKYTVQGVSFSFLALQDVLAPLDTERVKMYLDKMNSESDVQIVYVHWGNEYEFVHSKRQEELAQFFIENGADLVVGHHPHVVQDVALYKGKPIFYSLGNFIFDQYFSDDVQEMTLLKMQVTDTEITYTLVPLESKTVRSQPRVMVDAEKQKLLTRIMQNIDKNANVSVEKGVIHVPLF